MTGQAWPRQWCAVMPGDVVRDGAGRAWLVVKAAPDDAGRGLWVELDPGGSRPTSTMHIPDASTHVELAEGSGWGITAAGDAALDWAGRLCAEVLGATVVTPPPG